MIMVGNRKTGRTSLSLVLNFLTILKTIGASEEINCRETLARKFVHMTPPSTTLVISTTKWELPRISSHQVSIKCDQLKSANIQMVLKQSDSLFVNAVIDCNDFNLDIVDSLIYELDCTQSVTNIRDNYDHNAALDFQGRSLTIGVVLYTPFIVRKRLPSRRYHYSGYCIEILDTLSRSLNFSYKIRRKRTFGIEKANGEWTGAIGDLTRKKIDVMLTGMTIMAQRAKVVDFTYPFWEEPTGIIMRTAEKSSFVIARPLKPTVWLTFVSAIIVAAFAAFCLELFTIVIRSSWRKRRFSFLETLWSAFAVAVSQTTVKEPATRSAAGILLSFRCISIIILVTYSANLVSNLTLKEVDIPFETLEDLTIDTDHGIFVNDAGAHRTLMEDAGPNSIYGKLWKKARLLKGTTTKGVRNVLLENVSAVVMSDKTSLIVKAVRTKKCNWALLKEDFFKTNLGIALPKGSPFTKYFSLKIQEYQGTGLLKKWEMKHIQPWKEACKQDNVYTESTSIMMSDMWPVFVVLAAGAALAFVIFSMEHLADKLSCIGY